MKDNLGARAILAQATQESKHLYRLATKEDPEAAVHKGELLIAAMCYIEQAVDQSNKTPIEWPWNPKHWNPSGDAVKDLIKAGALIAVEIDRRLAEEEDGDKDS